jgi:hypothetical protein
MSGVCIILSIHVQWQSRAERCIYHNAAKHNIVLQFTSITKMDVAVYRFIIPSPVLTFAPPAVMKLCILPRSVFACLNTDYLMTGWSFIADMNCVLHSIGTELIYNYSLHDWQFRRRWVLWPSTPSSLLGCPVTKLMDWLKITGLEFHTWVRKR